MNSRMKITECRTEHSCQSNPSREWKLRSAQTVTITIQRKQGDRQVVCRKGQSLMEALIENGIFLPAICAARGSCGKCRIQILTGEMAVSKEDESFFSETELTAGYRLSCRAYPDTDCTIALKQASEEGFAVLEEYGTANGHQKAKKDGTIVASQVAPGNQKRKLGIAIDLGTTTIVMQLIDRQNREIMGTVTMMNKQRSYGADVISRIERSNQGRRQELQACICQTLQEGLADWMQDQDLREQMEQIVIAGNTTMIHLLMGYSCESLGTFPFKPVRLDSIQILYHELFKGEECRIPVTILPGISAFVGGDITAGLYSCGFAGKAGVSVLIDLGTNGEMAIGGRERIIVTSTAAGPAFEGGNISCGTGSIPGAICHVRIEEGGKGGSRAVLQTIGDRSPVGICGTGVIETVSELVRTGLVDETGLLNEEYFETGYLLAEGAEDRILFTQKDIRELQLAKAAIRAGLEVLIKAGETSCEEIRNVYLAGGFGYKLDIRKAVEIGLLPAKLENKVTAVGNSALSGAVKYLCESDGAEQMAYLISHAREIKLSNAPDFNEIYLQEMSLKKDKKEVEIERYG